jgi:excisionase family DNA binding protein
MDLVELRASRSAVVTISDAAAVLGVDARTVSRAVQNGELPALRVGRRLLIPRLLLLACLGATELPRAADAPSQEVDGERLEAGPSVPDAIPAA